MLSEKIYESKFSLTIIKKIKPLVLSRMQECVRSVFKC
jgi:hypothetical protein